MAGLVSLETLAPFYGLDPEPEETAGPVRRESKEWLSAALQAAEERARDLEAELDERVVGVVPVAATERVVERDDVVLEWVRAKRQEIDAEKETALDWALEIVEKHIDPPEEP